MKYLGDIQWASTDGTREVETDAFTFNFDDKADNSFDNELDRLTDNLSKLYNLKDMGEKSSHTRSLRTTINAGVNGGIDTQKNGAYGIVVRRGAKLTINGGTYYGGGTAVQQQEEYAKGKRGDPRFPFAHLAEILQRLLTAKRKRGTMFGNDTERSGRAVSPVSAGHV